MKRMYECLLSIHKSFWVSLHYFSLIESLHFPILVRYNTSLLSLKGRIKIKRPVKTGMFKIGFCLHKEYYFW